ncbi:MAG: hypothetical protein GF329_21435 [Candidatus Lokiarchaeota archaeon]|nr:hypothetical protein [Candidatus Lokiarchaeota archaeon]
MKIIDEGISCYSCEKFTWIHYTSKFIDYCEYFDEALPTNYSKELNQSDEKLTICKHFTLHDKFNKDKYENLIAQFNTFKDIKENLKDNHLYYYVLGNFKLHKMHEFDQE